jgi:hypothetical protein
MCCFYHTSNTINLVTASVDASVGIVEHTIFIPDFVDGRATARGVIFAKYVTQITKQQGRYAVGHGLSPLGNRASLSRCMHRRKVAAKPACGSRSACRVLSPPPQRSAQRTKAVAHTGISTPLAKNAKQRTPNCERDLRFPNRANPALSAA